MTVISTSADRADADGPRLMKPLIRLGICFSFQAIKATTFFSRCRTCNQIRTQGCYGMLVSKLVAITGVQRNRVNGVISSSG